MVSGSVTDKFITSLSFSHKDNRYSFPLMRTLPRQAGCLSEVRLALRAMYPDMSLAGLAGGVAELVIKSPEQKSD